MFTKLRKFTRAMQTATVAGRPVLARCAIVRLGQYVPRGATGRILRVRMDGDYDIAFDTIQDMAIPARRAEVAPAPALASRAPFGLRILSH